MAAGQVLAGLRGAAKVGSVIAEVVALEARRAVDQDPALTVADQAITVRASMATSNVVSLTQRRLMDPLAVIAGLPPDRRPAPSVAAYDELLKRRAAKDAALDSNEGPHPA